jgi:hypothetical protein
VIQISSLINKDPSDYDNSPTSALEEENRPNFRDKLKKTGAYMQPLLTQKSSITYSECVSVALVIQHAKRMRRIIFSSMACLAVPSFFPPTLFHKQHTRRNKEILNTKCVLWSPLQILSEIFLTLRKTKQYIIKLHRSSCKLLLILLMF